MRLRQLEDHPRACGEHSGCGRELPLSEGSSPRLRGTPAGAESVKDSPRIIPALAGNTPWPPSTRQRRGDHPRACGEHTTDLIAAIGRSGSSPRLRGTHDGGDVPARCDGIIPALAGNTRHPRTTARRARDHPRACGEHDPRRRKPGARVGSSPRLRGTLRQSRHMGYAGGIIPALAGNTSRTASLPAESGDHPRACGEHRYRPAGIREGVGSSPRLRGTRLRGLRR